MSDLFSLLNLGAAGLATQTSAVAVTTNNVSNVNTEGYSRQRVDFEALQGAPLVGGVRTGAPARVASDLLSRQVRNASSNLASSTASSTAILDLENRLTGTGPTVDEQISAFFGKLSQVSAAPTDKNVRDAAVSVAGDLAATIRRNSQDLASARTYSDDRIRDSAVEVTKLAKQLAELNRAVQKTPDAVLQDQRDLVAKRLSSLVGGAARIDADGMMRYVLDGGAVLVDGIHASSLTATRNPVTGISALTVVDGAASRDVTAEITNGTIGGELKFRDTIVVTAQGQLDQLAFDLTAAFNAVHAANADLNGNVGNNLFTPIATVAGAAAAMAVDPALAADSNRLATAAPATGPGDNTGALALFQLNTSTVTFGGTRTPVDGALDIVSGLALAGSKAKADLESDTLVDAHLSTLHDSLSGVDTQEEMVNLARYQNAASAMTKFISTIDSMLTSLIQNL